MPQRGQSFEEMTGMHTDTSSRIQVEVFVEKDAAAHTLELVQEHATVADALRKLSVAKSTVLCAKDGEVVTEDEVLRDKDTLFLYSVISGG